MADHDDREVLTVRMPRDLYERVRRLAVEEERTMNATARVALRRYVDAADAASGQNRTSEGTVLTGDAARQAPAS